MNTHFLIAGVMFYSLVIGVDPTPRPLPHIGKLGFLIAAMPFHAFFGIVLMTARFIIGDDFYSRLDLPWADLEQSQYIGGGIAWTGGEFPPPHRRCGSRAAMGETGRPRGTPKGSSLRPRHGSGVRCLQRHVDPFERQGLTLSAAPSGPLCAHARF